MERHIDVIGEGNFTEMATRFVAEVVVEVKGSAKCTVISEVTDFQNEALNVIRESGIAEDEISEGGLLSYQPWYWIRKPGQSARRKIILKVAEFPRLNTSLEALEPLRGDKRRIISVNLKQPEFDSTTSSRANALVAAFQDAREKAENLAKTLGRKLGNVLHVVEGRPSHRRSGFTGDEDWYGDEERFRRAGSSELYASIDCAVEDPGYNPANPTRDIWVKCRVRFELD